MINVDAVLTKGDGPYRGRCSCMNFKLQSFRLCMCVWEAWGDMV